jgi:hypothetical protein
VTAARLLHSGRPMKVRNGFRRAAARCGQTLAGVVAVLVLANSESCSSPADVEAADAAGARDALNGDAEAGDIDGGGRDASTTRPFTEEAMLAAADAFNKSYCPAFAKWDPVLFQFTFGTMPACLAARGLVAIAPGEVRFINELAAPYAYGSLLTPSKLLACVAALDFTTLEDWIRFTSERRVPVACNAAFFGNLAEGKSCGVWNQCASGRCLRPGSAVHGSCGVCVPRVLEGKSCQPYACDEGLTCRGSSDGTQVCTRYADIGQACIANREGRLTTRSTILPCRDHLVCEGGFCKLPPANEACDPVVGCSFVPYLRYCGPANQCVPLPFANLSERCDFFDGVPQGFRTCAHGTTCTLVSTPPGVDAASGYYECKPVIDDGDLCVGRPDNDHHCKTPDSRCFHDICRRNGPAECTAPPALP